MNAANVAQHNFFRGKPSSSTKKMDEKSRFGELPIEEEIHEIMDNAVPITTQKATKFGCDYLTLHISLKVSLKSCTVSDMTIEILRIQEMSKEELNVCLTCFYMSAKKKDGTYYKSSSMVHKSRH